MISSLLLTILVIVICCLPILALFATEVSYDRYDGDQF